MGCRVEPPLDAAIRLGNLVVVGCLVVVATVVISGIGVGNLNEQSQSEMSVT